MKVYHASKFIIESPDIYHSRDLLDFGKGFYLTSLVEQAKKYAQRFIFQGDKAYLNQLDENLDREYKTKRVYWLQRRVVRFRCFMPNWETNKQV